ncbi:hypothetical protein E4U55_000510 [Claviceps digitariae]|nr:hypothetical protein E4U55_000510 [Claviceps digitariae]
MASPLDAPMKTKPLSRGGVSKQAGGNYNRLHAFDSPEDFPMTRCYCRRSGLGYILQKVKHATLCRAKHPDDACRGAAALKPVNAAAACRISNRSRTSRAEQR